MDKNNVKGSLFRWSEESVEWYETASEYTGYHEKLKKIILPYLDKNDTCCELACGTGALARRLAPFVSSYTANDLDPNAVAFLNRRLKSEPQENINIYSGDWHYMVGKYQFNTVIFSYFSAVLRDWENLKKITTDKVISIAPRKDGRKRRTDSDKINNPEKVERNNGHAFETYGAVMEFLDEKNISYESFSLDLEFGQPFYDLDSAIKYIKYYYKLDGNDVDNFINVKFKKTDYGWYFPKLKEIGIVIADIRSEK